MPLYTVVNPDGFVLGMVMAETPVEAVQEALGDSIGLHTEASLSAFTVFENVRVPLDDLPRGGLDFSI